MTDSLPLPGPARPPAKAAATPHARVKVAAIPPNPPPQPVMVPAKQILGDSGPLVPPARAPQAPGKGQKVVATKLGYYDDKLQRVGDVFTLHRPEDFSTTWMAEADLTAPERTTGPNAALRQEHDTIVGATGGQGDARRPTGSADPLGDDEIPLDR